MSGKPKPVVVQDDVKALLKVSKGSLFVPIVLLFLAALAFAAFWLDSGRALLADNFERICQDVRSTGKVAGVAGLPLDTPSDRDVETEGPNKDKKLSGAFVLARPALSWGGLKPGDLIVKVEGKPVKSAQEAALAIRESLAKAPSVQFTVRRSKPSSTPAGKSGSSARGPVELMEQTFAVGAFSPVPFKSGGSLSEGPRHYRDWCAAGPTVGGEISALKADFRRHQNVWQDAPLNSFASPEIGGVKDLIRLGFAYAKVFIDDLLVAIRKYWAGGLLIIASSALFALIPGIAGMIYRRAFWTWFGIAFVALLAMRSLFANVGKMLQTGGSSGETAAAFAAGIVLFVLSQLAVVLLTQRLRRHSSRPPLLARFIPVNAYNRGLYLVLIAIGIGMAFFGLGKPIIELLPFSYTWTKWNVILLGLPFVYFLLKVTPTWPHAAPKNIVVCLDGTSNTPDQLDLGLAAQTNVFKLFSALNSDPGGSLSPSGRLDATLCKTYQDKQIALYYTGIGNKYDNDPLMGTLSQATGLGATGIIERAYLDVMRLWRPGDRVFIFGFSRGAASARILSRVIDQRGAPTSLWSLRLFGRHWTIWPSGRKNKVPITVLGCWDTVGSFGIAKTIGGINFQQLNFLHDLTVPESVEQAYHIVALDEERQEFEPTLMDPDPLRPERIVEVWMSGGHAGVGGGWATDRLSDVALDFILKRVSSGYCFDGTTEPGDEGWGLHLSAVNGMNPAAAAKAKTGVFVVNPDPLGQLRTYISNIYNYRPRQMPLHAVISETVFERMTKSVPVYAPQALFDLNDALDAKRDLIAEKVKKLEETHSMGKDERTKVLEFADKLRLTRFPQYWAGLAANRSPSSPPIDPAVILSNTRSAPPPFVK
ncbi:MAG: DUF2235 domain-containing protein [Hyphomicrobiaceae bacterium]|nr:DUF2235 domain-containing protein [Hyphomicrobiaceae bacterium]